MGQSALMRAVLERCWNRHGTSSIAERIHGAMGLGYRTLLNGWALVEGRFYVAVCNLYCCEVRFGVYAMLLAAL